MLKSRKNFYPNDLVFSLQRTILEVVEEFVFLLVAFQATNIFRNDHLNVHIFLLLVLAVFIIEVPSDVSVAGRSISGAVSCRFVFEEHELSHDTCTLGSVAIEKGVQNCKFGCQS